MSAREDLKATIQRLDGVTKEPAVTAGEINRIARDVLVISRIIDALFETLPDEQVDKILELADVR